MIYSRLAVSLLLYVWVLLSAGCTGVSQALPNALPPASKTVSSPDDQISPAVPSVIPESGSSDVPLFLTETVTKLPETLTFQVIDTYPHDSGAFTEGLVIYDGILYETTGLNGRSSIRQVDLASGRIEKTRNLEEEYFGEGLAIYDEKMVWVTWKNNSGFVYDLNSFDLIDQFSYSHEGWGLAFDGDYLYLSDGTDTIHILSPADYTEIGSFRVTDEGQPVTKINELEFINGDLYANIWLTTKIARIDTGTGSVTGWLDLGSLLDEFTQVGQSIDVLNGIAYNQDTQQIFVTGKYWPKIFQIQIFDSSGSVVED